MRKNMKTFTIANGKKAYTHEREHGRTKMNERRAKLYTKRRVKHSPHTHCVRWMWYKLSFGWAHWTINQWTAAFGYWYCDEKRLKIVLLHTFKFYGQLFYVDIIDFFHISWYLWLRCHSPPPTHTRTYTLVYSANALPKTRRKNMKNWWNHNMMMRS